MNRVAHIEVRDSFEEYVKQPIFGWLNAFFA